MKHLLTLLIGFAPLLLGAQTLEKVSLHIELKKDTMIVTVVNNNNDVLVIDNRIAEEWKNHISSGGMRYNYNKCDLQMTLKNGDRAGASDLFLIDYTMNMIAIMPGESFCRKYLLLFDVEDRKRDGDMDGICNTVCLFQERGGETISWTKKNIENLATITMEINGFSFRLYETHIWSEKQTLRSNTYHFTEADIAYLKQLADQ